MAPTQRAYRSIGRPRHAGGSRALHEEFSQGDEGELVTGLGLIHVVRADEYRDALTREPIIAQQRFDVGGISEVSMLDAKRQDLQSSLDRSHAEAQRLADTAALLHALAGSEG
jgi:hypothetical protein